MPRLPRLREVLWVSAAAIAVGGVFFLLAQDASPVAFPSLTPSHVPLSITAPPHRYNDLATSLADIQLHVVYFVPRDRQDLIMQNWKAALEPVLAQMRAFHRLQLLSRSTLDYTINSDVMLGEEDGSFYDSAITNGGNPHAWKAVHDELDRRLEKSAPPDGSHAFPVRLVIYEGVGALGGEQRILVSSGYLRLPHAASIFYHELGHVFGLKDAYEYGHDTPLSEDIMGLGRIKPIGQAYVSEEAKRGLGITF